MTQVTVLVSPSAVTTTFPTITAGSNRKALLMISGTNPAGAAMPTSLTIGGVTPTHEGGLAIGGTNLRAANGLFSLNEAQIAAMSGSAIVRSGGSLGEPILIAMVIQDTAQTASVDKGVYSSGGASVTSGATASFARIAESWTLFGLQTNALSVATLSNPSTSTSFNSANTTATIGYAADTARDVASSFTGVGRIHAFSVNFRPVPAQDITSVNGGTNSVQIGSSGNTVETVNLTGVTAASLNGVAMTSVAGSSSPWTFTCPPLTDGAVSPYPSGTFSITGAEGSPTLAGVAVTLPTGLVAQVLAGTLNTTNTGVLYNFSPAAVVTDQIFYPPVPTVGKYITIDAQGNIDTDYEGTTQFWHWQASTGITRSYDVIVGAGGSSSNITSAGLTSIGLTRVGLTSSGL